MIPVVEYNIETRKYKVGGEKMANNQKPIGIRKEVAWVVYGSVLGVLSGTMGDLVSSYIVKVLEASGYTDWMLILIPSAVVFVITIACMGYWAIRQIKRAYQPT